MAGSGVKRQGKGADAPPPTTNAQPQQSMRAENGRVGRRVAAHSSMRIMSNLSSFTVRSSTASVPSGSTMALARPPLTTKRCSMRAHTCVGERARSQLPTTNT